MTVSAPWQLILKRLAQNLRERGFETRTTFDLQLARGSLRNPAEVACPHHGPGKCSCQYIVLQISRPEERPSVVLLHGSDNSTRIDLISAFAGKVDTGIATVLCEALEHAGSFRSPRIVPREVAGEPAHRRVGRT